MSFLPINLIKVLIKVPDKRAKHSGIQAVLTTESGICAGFCNATVCPKFGHPALILDIFMSCQSLNLCTEKIVLQKL